ncbi:MAG: SLBB domain-containing protein [Caulobacteraceae bacterium]
MIPGKRGASTRRRGSFGRTVAVACLSVLAGLSSNIAGAQVVSDYGYGAQTYQPNAAGGGGSGGGYGGNAYGGGPSGQGGPYGYGQGPVSGGGGFQNSVPSGDFNPIMIPNGSGAEGDLTLAPIPRLTPEGAIAAPLYIRPGKEQGQFELLSRPAPQPGEFEKFVKQTLGRSLPRFGSTLILNGSRGFAAPPTTTVPPDYRLNPGDQLLIGVTGSVEADLRLTIDSEGKIFVPRLGAINVAGVRYGDLSNAIARRFAEQYKNVRISVVIARLHGLTVYVTGFAVRPGAYTVSSLSTMVDAVLASGGPSAGGSFRTVQLRRGGRLVSELDLYDLLLNGDKSHDAIVQNEDVINIAPAGPELAVTGSVNAEAIYEVKPGETLGDVLRYAGGLNSLADRSRIVVASLADLDAQGSRQLPFAQAQTYPAEAGDIVRVLSLADIARPLERQAVLATIEGEVDHPGRYYLKPGSTVGDLLAVSGGLTPGAFVYATEFSRESVRRQQKAGFEHAIDDLELSATLAPLTPIGADKTADAARHEAALKFVEKLKDREPDGRLVLDVSYASNALPVGLALENLDHIYVPPRPKTVGVFGAVYQPGSFIIGSGVRIGDYLKLAGGPKKVADRGQIFVVRANGAVQSGQSDHGLLGRPALPGDVIFVPVRTSPGAFQRILDIAQIVYQFGVGALTLKAIS